MFRMDPEAVSVLRRFKGPLGVVAVCGRARQGKSFILNQVRASALDHIKPIEASWMQREMHFKCSCFLRKVVEYLNAYQNANRLVAHASHAC